MSALLLLDQRVFWSVLAGALIGVVVLVAGAVGIVRHVYVERLKEVRAELEVSRAETEEWRSSALMYAAVVDHKLGISTELPGLRLIRGGDEAC